MKLYIKSLFLCLALAIPYQALCKQQPKILVKVATTKPAEFFEKYIAVGQCKSENSRTYNAKVVGTVDSIAITQGDNVQAGDVLITIDKKLAESHKIAAKTAFHSAQVTYKRNLLLLEKKIIPEATFNNSKVAFEHAKAELAKAINQYNDMIIKAPFNGYIGVVRANVGNQVKVGDYLFSLVAGGNKIIFIELPETLYGKINDTSEVSIIDLSNNKVTGKIIAVSDYLSEQGTITARVMLPPTTNIVHGSYVETEIIYNKHTALAILEKAILKNEDGSFVYKVTEENLTKKIYVTLGVATGNMVELTSNELKKGDIIVVEGLTKIQDNTAVELIKE
ncbi:MAG: efflux RND transporter periplasmic adaptor subunit [Candidatus Rickettsia vulgarisii]